MPLEHIKGMLQQMLNFRLRGMVPNEFLLKVFVGMSLSSHKVYGRSGTMDQYRDEELRMS